MAILSPSLQSNEYTPSIGHHDSYDDTDDFRKVFDQDVTHDFGQKNSFKTTFFACYEPVILNIQLVLSYVKPLDPVRMISYTGRSFDHLSPHSGRY